ncbi:3-phosphoshikimate 1-carboxyvinyltransferase [Candidatus Peregrinibacteria bacterium]|jgi:3-phosphoshikimate 1-carboxyvinyltransferase|nr:3-phosphoshikimate 1-carboxyvinyltransferase [Candidatus Peregrinibacteria bacterium]MBT4055831.1 3-phosphoshikimate 1-carboxyvinyltransferase [Candidatus Peregrinibacteria bacterium]
MPSKSITNRAQIISFIAKLQTGKKLKLSNIGECDDVHYLREGLKKLSTKSPGKIHLGNAGTAVRFITTLACCLNKEVVITGEKRMKERPIKPLTDVLTQLDANLETNKGCPPINIKPSTLTGGKIKIPGNISSQYITSLLLSSPLMQKGLTIQITGDLLSRPYIEMTIALMKKCGIKVETSKNFRTIKIAPNQKYKPTQLQIEKDASSASYLGEYAILKSIELQKPVKITIKNLPKNSIQGDIFFTEYLKKMGCHIKHTKDILEITGTPNPKPLGTIDMGQTPDLVMTFAVLAALIPETTTITNISTLKIKESDRIQALKNELTKLEVKVTTTKDQIKITGQKSPKPLANKRKTIDTYNDHRIAMAFGVLKKTLLPKLTIKKPSVVRKSYPKFWADINKLNKTHKPNGKHN